MWQEDFMNPRAVLLIVAFLSCSSITYARADTVSNATEIIVVRILQIRDGVCMQVQPKLHLTCRSEYNRALAVVQRLEANETTKREMYAAGNFASAGLLQERIDADFKEINGILDELRQKYKGS